MQRMIQLLGACSGWGAQKRACEQGPLELLVQEQIGHKLIDKGIPIRSVEMVYPPVRASDQDIPLSESLPLIHAFHWRLAQAVRQIVKRGDFPVVLGGDHSNAVGVWNGVDAPLGLLWIDAHMDAHTPKTSPSGAYHGMPLAALLGHGDPAMAHLLGKEAILQPENVALLGVRSFEEGEAQLLKKLGVRVYFMEEIRQRGLAAVFEEALAHVGKNVPRIGISLDLDVFDPQDAPGVGSPEPGGISASEFLPLLSLVRAEQKLVGLEIVEYNPEEDIGRKTEDLVFHLLYEALR